MTLRSITAGLLISFLVCTVGHGHGGGTMVFLEAYLIAGLFTGSAVDGLVLYFLSLALVGQVCLLSSLFVRNDRAFGTLSLVGIVCKNLIIVPGFILTLVTIPVIALTCVPFLVLSLWFIFKRYLAGEPGQPHDPA